MYERASHEQELLPQLVTLHIKSASPLRAQMLSFLERDDHLHERMMGEVSTYSMRHPPSHRHLIRRRLHGFHGTFLVSLYRDKRWHPCPPPVSPVHRRDRLCIPGHEYLFRSSSDKTHIDR